ncbi:MAG TPA: hypothetical protein VGW57_04800 [Chthoniobacterales bacterium]|nr:hypothetical protein [Chthoniobacterales bacterium]
MEIKARAFPYPVLAPASDDFTEGAVRLTNAAADAAPERYSIRFRFEVTHPSLSEMIANGTASAGVIVECRQNLYRRRHDVVVGSNEMQLPADELRGQVQVTPVISAARELSDYRPQHLNDDYTGVVLQVPRYGVLAYGPNLEFIADPRADRLRKISSIMRVVQTTEPGTTMKINIDGARIHVEVSAELFRIYQSVATSRQATAVLASMLVLPVLLDVFHRIRGTASEGLEDLRWFQVVCVRLREIAQPWEASDFDPLKAAQALLDSPFARGITELIERLDLEGGD